MILMMGVNGMVGRDVARRASKHGPERVGLDFDDASTSGATLRGDASVFLLRPPHPPHARRRPPACV
jgi:nucleoside-diphosphate-sugar epimerase